jgi:ubiquinol-cytochrome c reductase cytochrome b subunit
MTSLWKEHVSEYYAPKNFNFWYYFGSIALFVLALQIVTGIFLTMSYKPSATEAFGSVEYIMRDVEWGWLIRYMHSTGRLGFFIVVYLHMFRALLYGSHRKPRELLWIFGVLIYLALMAEAFFGYLLPWGNMSYWGAQVIVSLFGTIPADRRFAHRVDPRRLLHLGHHAEPLLRAARGRAAAGPDLPRRRAHPRAARGRLEQPGRHRDQEDEGTGRHPLDGIRSSVLHGQGPVRSQRLPRAVRGRVFFAPEMGGLFLEPPNFEPANALLTPPHIAPVWYFTPYYAILRAVPPS